MKKSIIVFLFATVIVFNTGFIEDYFNLISFKKLSQYYSNSSLTSNDLDIFVPGSCTIFSAAFNDKVLFGNNEDYREIPLYYWTQPTTEETYGGVYFGFDNFSAQGGVNEKGLVFDYNALPVSKLNPHPDLPQRGAIMNRIQQTCVTVEEAILVAKSYNWGGNLSYQINMADATGNAVVISAGTNGELEFTQKKNGEKFLLSTNFNLANPSNTFENSYPCWRYIKAFNMLKKIKNKNDLTEAYFRHILKGTHIESGLGNTLYSQVYDLKSGNIYLYYWHQYDESVIINIIDAIKTVNSPILIKNLFSKNTIERATNEYNNYIKDGIE